jgi:hypothetical protein
MRKVNTILSVVSLLIAGSAFAEDKKPAAAAAKPPEMAAPKPAPELQQYKMMIGNWKCQGKGTMMGKEMKMTGSYKAAWDLDNYWVVAHLESKAAGMPGSLKGTDLYSYDATNKMYIVMSVDNMGGWAMAKSKGWEGDKQEWAGKGTMMGKEQDMKYTVTKKGDKEITIAGGMGADTFEQTCKK